GDGGLCYFAAPTMTGRTASQLDVDDLPVPRAADAAEVLRVAAEASDGGLRAAMATVLARRGSAPSTPGQKLVLVESGECAGTVVEDRERWAERGEDGPRLRRIAGDFVFAGRSVPRRGIALAVTHDHQLDQRVVEWALKESFAFVGGVGSRAKAARTRARLE